MSQELAFASLAQLGVRDVGHADTQLMDDHQFYRELFKPIAERIGPLDAETITGIIGFDAGGPLSLCTVGRGAQPFVTYVSCELAVRSDQCVGESGAYELMIVCDDERWARTVLSGIARVGLEAELDAGHTIDIGNLVGDEFAVHGAILEEFASVQIEGRRTRILLVHGVTRDELAYAFDHGTDAVLERRQRAGVYPRTRVG